MIGNDIVDLQLAQQQSNWQRRGFLKKQFTAKEIEFIRQSKEPFNLVWRIWSMKEAAYKVVAQQEKRRFFAPTKFECDIFSEAFGIVKYKHQTFQTLTMQTANYIYSSVGKSSYQWLGNKILEQQEIVNIISKLSGKDETDLEIRKDQHNIPNLYLGENQLSSSFSMTHHGRFFAFEYK